MKGHCVGPGEGQTESIETRTFPCSNVVMLLRSYQVLFGLFLHWYMQCSAFKEIVCCLVL